MNAIGLLSRTPSTQCLRTATSPAIQLKRKECLPPCLTKSGHLCMNAQNLASSFYPLLRNRTSVSRCTEGASDHVGSGRIEEDVLQLNQAVKKNEIDIIKILLGANSVIPHVVLASTALALIFPPSFTWFTNRYYAPALGFLMFAVGVNSSAKDFAEAFKRPAAILAGCVAQYVIKPLLGFLFGTIAVMTFGLPTSAGAGIMLVSCVSGAQLSNYATFLTDPHMAPLSIVMTSLSTAAAVFMTPTLSLLLIGKRLPVDVKGMMSSIMQIVVAPIAGGLLLNKYFPSLGSAIRPVLPPLSVFVTALCVGSPLAINIQAILSPFGFSIFLLILGFHLAAFIVGYVLTGLAFLGAPDVKALRRTLSFETGMQTSLLALALANKFFDDPIVGIPPAISVVLMSLIAFSLVLLWTRRKPVAV